MKKYDRNGVYKPMTNKGTVVAYYAYKNDKVHNIYVSYDVIYNRISILDTSKYGVLNGPLLNFIY